jgi:hypothetical protein
MTILSAHCPLSQQLTTLMMGELKEKTHRKSTFMENTNSINGTFYQLLTFSIWHSFLKSNERLLNDLSQK